MIDVWSWLLGSIGILGLFLTTQKLAIGFAVGIVVQVLWVIYAVSTDQYGFLISAPAYAFVNLLGLYQWTRRPTYVSEEE